MNKVYTMAEASIILSISIREVSRRIKFLDINDKHIISSDLDYIKNIYEFEDAKVVGNNIFALKVRKNPSRYLFLTKNII